MRRAEEHLGRLSDRKSAPAEPGLYRGGERKEPRAIKEAQILLGFPAPTYMDRAFTTSHIFSAILGGGMASRLFQEVRERRGLCYSIYSFYWPFTDTGVFGIQAATSEEDIEELVRVVLDELGKMSDGVTAVELGRAKTQLRAGLLMTLESPIARAGQMARHILVHDRALSLEEMVERVDAVGEADLAGFAASLLNSPPTLAAIGPVKELPSVDAIAATMAGQKSAVGW